MKGKVSRKRGKKAIPSLRLSSTEHPLLYEVNTRVLLNELSASSGQKTTLGAIPDELIDEWASHGFDAIWLMGVWSSGSLGQTISRTYPDLKEEYRKALPDLSDKDIIGSPYAVKAYTVSRTLGGNRSLAVLRERLRDRGIGLVLDYVSNHTARDHSWVSEHPEFYLPGEEGDEASRPDEYFRTQTDSGERVLAYGRDPSFAGWTDTAQLNYFNPELRERMLSVLQRISKMCDGVRCDMAMLTMNRIFDETWGEGDRLTESVEGRPTDEFWKTAIDTVKGANPDFLFLAEAYWDMGWDLQNLGFDYTYDKTLYDRLLYEGAESVREHLRADIAFQKKLIRFIENHDEKRAAQTLPSPLWHCAAATVFASIPGMALFHEGQLEGRVVRVPVQLGRRPSENSSPALDGYYRKLLECLSSEVFRAGTWSLLDPRAAWHENSSWENFLCFWWELRDERRLVVVNYSPNSGQCYVPLPVDGLPVKTLEFRDLTGPAAYYRETGSLSSRGMFFDLPAYGVHFFEVKMPA